MSIQFFLHIFNKKFWLQFICNKLISTTAHESENNLDKIVYAYLTPDFRKHISRELWYILFVWSFSVMRYLRPLLKHLTQLIQSWARTHAVLVIGLYELLDPTT